MIGTILARLFPKTLAVGTYGLPFLQVPLTLRSDQINTHWHILGTSGSGKSYFLLNLFLTLFRHGYPVTLIDPHGDLAKLVLSHLVAQGIYQDEGVFERVIYLDLPEGERQERFVPLNPLMLDLPMDAITSNFTDTMHRAFPELSQGAAIFDTLLPRSLRVLLAHNLPLTAVEPFLYDHEFRRGLLDHLPEEMATIKSYFQNVYDKLKDSERISYAGSVMRRAILLTELPILQYSLSPPANRLPIREILDSGRSVILNLAVRNLAASRLLGCLLTVGYEQAALSRADTPERPTHHLIIDEFASFATQSSKAFSTMLSQTRKRGLYLCLAHQFWGQATEHLRQALQNTGIDVVFNVGAEDAEQEAKALCRVDPLQVKHEVADEDALERTHPVYSSGSEQLRAYTEWLQDMRKRHFALKVGEEKGVKAGKTLYLPKPQVDPGELAEVEQEYLRRYFTAKREQPRPARAAGAIPEPSQAGKQPITWRERL